MIVASGRSGEDHERGKSAEDVNIVEMDHPADRKGVSKVPCPAWLADRSIQGILGDRFQ